MTRKHRPGRTLRRVLRVFIAFIAFFFLFAGWYKIEYSMKPVDSYAINSPQLEEKLLIATQGSRFKNAVVDDVIEAMEVPDRYIFVMDVSNLKSIDPSKWSAVLILHTWENWKPQEDVAAFIDRYPDASNLVVLATSGDGSLMIEGVDGITAASILTDAPAFSATVIERLSLILGEPSDQWAH